MMLRALTGSVVVVLTLATAAAAGKSLSAMTLQLQDLPAGYTQVNSNACPASCVLKIQRKVPAGYVSGWEREYYAGLKLITSGVSLYETPATATASVQSSWRTVERKACKRVTMAQKIGAGARMYFCGVSVYVVVWRSGEFKAAISLIGDRADGELAARLAVKQQARMQS